MTDFHDRIHAAIAERDDVIASMDAHRARQFVANHGGVRYDLNWETILHLARWEINTVPWELREASRRYLARIGHYGITQMNPRSQYTRAALDLIFPHDLFEESQRLEETP